MSDIEFKGTYFTGTGKRKTSIARVRLYKGTGRVVVNGKTPEQYFATAERANVLMDPLHLAKASKQFDVSVVVTGGGLQGQAEASRHGVSRALVAANAENRPTLKPEGFLTRDSRIRERKKPGLHRARRAPQFSKR